MKFQSFLVMFGVLTHRLLLETNGNPLIKDSKGMGSADPTLDFPLYDDDEEIEDNSLVEMALKSDQEDFHITSKPNDKKIDKDLDSFEDRNPKVVLEMLNNQNNHLRTADEQGEDGKVGRNASVKDKNMFKVVHINNGTFEAKMDENEEDSTLVESGEVPHEVHSPILISDDMEKADELIIFMTDPQTELTQQHSSESAEEISNEFNHEKPSEEDLSEESPFENSDDEDTASDINDENLILAEDFEKESLNSSSSNEITMEVPHEVHSPILISDDMEKADELIIFMTDPQTELTQQHSSESAEEISNEFNHEKPSEEDLSEESPFENSDDGDTASDINDENLILAEDFEKESLNSSSSNEITMEEPLISEGSEVNEGMDNKDSMIKADPAKNNSSSELFDDSLNETDQSFPLKESNNSDSQKIFNKTKIVSIIVDKLEELSQGLSGSMEVPFSSLEEGEDDSKHLSPNSLPTEIGGVCPQINTSKVCEKNPPSTCWTPGFQDVDCVGRGEVCCFDGCGNFCLHQLECEKVPVNETMTVEFEVEKCRDVPLEVCKEFEVKECSKDCRNVSELVSVPEKVEVCKLKKEEVCEQELTTVCKNEEIPLVQDVRHCENVTTNDCQVPNCTTIFTPSCKIISQKIPKDIIQEKCTQSLQAPECEIELKEKCVRKAVPQKITKPQEICRNETQEFCREEVGEKDQELCVKKPKYTCKIVQVPKIGVKKVKKCKIHKFKRCRMFYKEVCSANTYSSYSCQKVPQTICQDVPKRKCGITEVTIKEKVPQRKCQLEYSQDCRVVQVPTKEKVCENVTQSVCSEELIQSIEEVVQDVCEPEKVEVCGEPTMQSECKPQMVTVYDEVDEEICTEVPEEVCNDCEPLIEEICSLRSTEVTETRHVCVKEQRPVCKEVESEVCQVVEKLVTKPMLVETCEDICIDVPKTKCETKLNKECTKVIEPKEVTVLVDKCV